MKKEIIRIFYGGRPSSDLPFLWKLEDEIEEAVDCILKMDDFKKFEYAFLDRPNPKHSRFAYAIATKENEVLQHIITEIK